jgi:CCT motif
LQFFECQTVWMDSFDASAKSPAALPIPTTSKRTLSLAPDQAPAIVQLPTSAPTSAAEGMRKPVVVRRAPANPAIAMPRVAPMATTQGAPLPAPPHLLSTSMADAPIVLAAPAPKHGAAAGCRGVPYSEAENGREVEGHINPDTYIPRTLLPLDPAVRLQLLRERREQAERFREKKRSLSECTRKIRYASRKAYAQVRPRVKGRFARKDEVAAMRAAVAVPVS